MKDEMNLEFPISTPNAPEDRENPEERLAFDIEQALKDFVDEPSIRHNVFPNLDSDDEEVVKQVQKQRTDIRRGDGILYDGQVFINGVAFKEAVLDYAMKSYTNIKQYKYDPVKAGYKCIGGHKDTCAWRIYCSIDKKLGKWKVKRFHSDHSCNPNGACAIFRTPVIARLFIDKIRSDSKYFMPMKLEEIIKQDFRIVVSRGQCQQARYKALEWIEKEYEQQFASIRNYKGEILESNPGSSVEVECIKDVNGQDVFNRFYVCFDTLRKAWKASCRPLLGLDGSFMRANMKGQVLVALGRDADNAIYHVAWAVVAAENYENWDWFVKKIQIDLDLGDGRGFIMVFDRQKGLLKAVRLVLPEVEHRMCVQHIYGNLKAKFGKRPHMKWLIWQLGWSYNEAEYKINMDKIAIYDSAVYVEVLKSKPEKSIKLYMSSISVKLICFHNFPIEKLLSFKFTFKKYNEQKLANYIAKN